MRPWYDLKAAGADSPAEVFIYGDIGDKWDEHGVIAADLVRDLSALQASAINLRINSYGGSVPDALAIYNALRSHKAKVNAVIEGVAMSSASYIAMAGDTVEMAANAQLMIHAPWTVAVGNAANLRETAEVLDRFARSLAAGYDRKTGNDCLPLLMDGQDHYYSAAEAKAAGFVDVITGELPIAAAFAQHFDLSRFTSRAADSAASLTQEPKMATTDTTTAEQPIAAEAKVFSRTRDQNRLVLEMFQTFPQLSALKDELLADTSITVDDARARLIEALGKTAQPVNPVDAGPRVEVLADETDKLRACAVASLLDRSGTTRTDMTGNPYRGSTLLDLAKASLQRAGVKTTGLTKMDIVATAFTQSTSDFPVLLENTMHKALQAAYATAALTWTRFCATGSVSDFRAHNRYRTGSFGNLDAVSELGEFTNKSIPDGEKSSISIGTKGNIINLSRQAVINDDLGAFVGLSANLGRAAARTIEAAVYALLAENSGLGPTMGDTYTLFHANHGNLTTGAALSVSAIDADRVAMASQKDVSSNDYLDLRPQVLLVPMALGSAARVLNSAEYDPDAVANKPSTKPNVVRGLFGDVVDSPRLTGTRRYLFANPVEAPVIEVAFLDGNRDPYLETENGFTVDGARYKVRIDFGVGAIDYRGAVTNAGA